MRTPEEEKSPALVEEDVASIAVRAPRADGSLGVFVIR